MIGIITLVTVGVSLPLSLIYCADEAHDPDPKSSTYHIYTSDDGFKVTSPRGTTVCIFKKSRSYAVINNLHRCQGRVCLRDGTDVAKFFQNVVGHGGYIQYCSQPKKYSVLQNIWDSLSGGAAENDDPPERIHISSKLDRRTSNVFKDELNKYTWFATDRKLKTDQGQVAVELSPKADFHVLNVYEDSIDSFFAIFVALFFISSNHTLKTTHT